MVLKASFSADHLRRRKKTFLLCKIILKILDRTGLKMPLMVQVGQPYHQAREKLIELFYQEKYQGIGPVVIRDWASGEKDKNMLIGGAESKIRSREW